MPIIKKDEWELAVANNQDPYGNACIKVARRVMEILDAEQEFDPHKIICRADDETKAGGITGFMAGCVAQMVSAYHSRGEEFRRSWNQFHGVRPKQDRGGVVNPAVVTLETK